MQGAESVLNLGMLVVKPMTSCQGCDRLEAKFGLSAPFFLFGRKSGCLPQKGLCRCQAEKHRVALAREGADFGTEWQGSLAEQVMVWPGLSHAWEQPGPLLLWLGSAARHGALQRPRCHPTGSHCGRAGLHSPNLLQPDRITMPAHWVIMASVCLRYKGTALSHEVILISYTLIHHSACQPAAGPAAAPACLH